MLKTILKSRTFWTVLVLVLVNVINVYGKYLPTDVITLVNLMLGTLTTYFHVNPSQSYGTNN